LNAHCGAAGWQLCGGRGGGGGGFVLSQAAQSPCPKASVNYLVATASEANIMYMRMTSDHVAN